jgi:hypothetical protein
VKPHRIWIDVTGLRPGGDAGMYALNLYAALRRAGREVQACLRAPGLVTLSEAELRSLLLLPPSEMTIETVPGMPEWTPISQQHDGPDCPASGDDYLMLSINGDASRFAASGARLSLVATNATVLARPEWRTKRELLLAEEWLRHTAPVISHAVLPSEGAAKVMAAAGIANPHVITGAPDVGTPLPGPAHPRPFIFASGEISEAGQTRQLPLVWRRLYDTMPAEMVPDLLIAGPISSQSGDVLTQLRNSRLLEGRARLVAFPSPAQIASFARDCVFAIAMAAGTGWGRGTLNAQLFAAPCLSAYSSYGAVPFDPTNAAGIAARIRAWLVDPAVKPPVMTRNWDDVAQDMLRVLSA